MLNLTENNWEAPAAAALFAAAWSEIAPPSNLTIGEWAESRRILSTEETALPGRFSLAATPALRGILAACSEPTRRKVVSQKPAQIGYTAGVVCNVIGYHADHKPSVQVAVFPREKSAKDFAAEKMEPMIRATPTLAARIDLGSRKAGQSITRRQYPGGLIKLVGANSPSDVKSTSARIVIVEEPDDASQDVRGQGDAIKLAEERAKSYPDHLILIGGTPTAKGASSIEAEMRVSDQRHFWIACPHCQARHVPAWEYVIIPQAPEATAPREVYKLHRWEDAAYHCPHCAAQITDDQRILAICHASEIAPGYGWEPTADSQTAGFYANELLSIFDGSRVPILARKYLEAKHEMENGNTAEMIVFWNSTLGLPWEYKGELPEEDELRARAESYAEWTCPQGGLIPLLSVDVQHDRLAVTCWVMGRADEMWLAYWGEFYGPTVVAHQGAWIELEQTLAKTVRHASGSPLRLAAVGIDCSDGQTSDASYAFVRKHNRPDRQVLALKGSSDSEGKIEIWTPPKAIDPNNRATKASRYGLATHIVGTARAKDLILGWSEEGGRVRLEGSGPGRMHWYEGVRDDFYEQLLSEIKIPHRLNPRKRTWKPRTDRRNECLDCTVYAVYLSRHLRLHLRRPTQWDLDEMRLRQSDLLGTPAPVQVPQPDHIEDILNMVEPAAEPDQPDPPTEQDVTADIASARFAAMMRNRRAARNVNR